ncbi:MAG: GNAT family N-acetyltransferase [Candidatus Atribacteria bacterium]|nr:GNAT family N-acetyltransferase [Candidatus Atribacteria bacterium]
MINIRVANKNDREDFAELLLLSASYFPIVFGENIKNVLKKLFCHCGNLFSFEHVYFAEIDQKNAAMMLSYNSNTKDKENLRTGSFLFKETGIKLLGKLSMLLKMNNTVGNMPNNSYYISNIATYPAYRGRGIAKQLMLLAENEARIANVKIMVLDVESENLTAINLYQKLDYKKNGKFIVPLQNGEILSFDRMIKEIKQK